MKYIFLIAHLSMMSAPEFRQMHARDWESALGFLRQHHPEFSISFQQYGGDAEILVPVIFPELVRYSILRDQAEVLGLKIFYVNFGRQYADFSIGRFQMKPSFAVEVEQDGIETSSACRELKPFAGSDAEKEERRARVHRLESLKWQLVYLQCFGALVAARGGNGFKTMEAPEKVRYLAEYYNAGIRVSEKERRYHSRQPYYPYGKSEMKRNLPYWQVAVHYHENHTEDWK